MLKNPHIALLFACKVRFSCLHSLYTIVFSLSIYFACELFFQHLDCLTSYRHIIQIKWTIPLFLYLFSIHFPYFQPANLDKHNPDVFLLSALLISPFVISPYKLPLSFQQKRSIHLDAPLMSHILDYQNYSITSTTEPAPTVLPPSRMENLRPISIATGVISSIVISTLSPGMHISVPSGRLITPVTSVVLK